MTHKFSYIVGILFLLFSIGCSSANFDVGAYSDDSGIQEGGADTDPTETGLTQDTNDTGVKTDTLVDTGMTDGASTDPDTGALDSGATTSDTGDATSAGDSGTGDATDSSTSDSGDAMGDSMGDTGGTTSDSGSDATSDSGSDAMTDTGSDGDGSRPVICTPYPTWTPVAWPPTSSDGYVSGSTRCNGMQVEYCSPDGTAWLPVGGVCEYACIDATPTVAASCQCNAPARFVTVTEKYSPDGYAIKDTVTGLTWADSDYNAGSPSSPSYTLSYTLSSLACNRYYSGAGGWRVPTKAEMERILAALRGPGPWGDGPSGPILYPTCFPDIDTTFKIKTDDEYWTSDAYSVGQAWAVIPSNGTEEHIDVTVGAHVRCVHD